jgi:hypothetical protein
MVEEEGRRQMGHYSHFEIDLCKKVHGTLVT